MSEDTPLTHEQLEQAVTNLTQAVGSGARWFFWITVLSLVNSISTYMGLKWSFVIGLNSTQIFDGLGMDPKLAAVKGLFIVFSVLGAAIFGLLGFFGVKLQRWALITGFVLYILDTAILLLVFFGGADGSLILNGLFHLWALYGIFQGIKASGLLNKIKGIAAQTQREAQLVGLTATPPPPPYVPVETPPATESEPPAPVE